MSVKLGKETAIFWLWLPVVQVGVFAVIMAWLLADLSLVASATAMPVRWDTVWYLTKEVAVGVFQGALIAHTAIWLFVQVRPAMRRLAIEENIPMKVVLVLEAYAVSVLVVAFTPLRPVVQSLNIDEAIPIMFSQFSASEMLVGILVLTLLCLLGLRATGAITSWRKIAVLLGGVIVVAMVITPNAAQPDYDYYISRARSIRFLRPDESKLSPEAAQAVLELAKSAERVSTEPWQRAYSLYNQSRAYFWLEDYERAKETALASRQLNPHNPWVHTILADIAIEEKRYDEVEAHLVECEKWPEPGFPCYADERRVTVAWLEGRLSDAFALLEKMQTAYSKSDYPARLLAWYTANAVTPYLDKEEYLAREDAFFDTCGNPYRDEACFREFIMLRWGNGSFVRANEAFDTVLSNPEIYPFAENVTPLYNEMLADIARMERDQALTAEPVAVFDDRLVR